LSPRIDLSKDLSYRDVYRYSVNEKVSFYIDDKKINELREIREKFLRYIESGGVCYGVSTGLGAQLTKKVSSPEQYYHIKILMQHAAGVGDFLPREVVRGAMIILARQLSLGYSAVDPYVIELLVEMLNKNIIPLVPRYGSLGASGDLAPMSYIGLSLYGKGLVEDENGRRGYAEEIMREHGIEPLRPKPKDFLSIINNTAMSASVASHATYKADKLLISLIITSSISIEAMATPKQHFSQKIAGLKRYESLKIISRILNMILEDSSVENKDIIQDRYSFRTIPQILGSYYEGLIHVRDLVDREINSSSDNPVFVDGECVSGGNFYGVYIANAMDYLAHLVVQPLIQVDRRVFTILDPNLNRGLPPFLTEKEDVGLMIAQYTISSLLNRISLLVYPSTIFTTPTSASQEDHVSNSYNAALKTLEIMDLAMDIAAIEYLVSSYALSKRPWFDKTSSMVKRFVKELEPVFNKMFEEKTLGELFASSKKILDRLSDELLKLLEKKKDLL